MSLDIEKTWEKEMFEMIQEAEKKVEAAKRTLELAEQRLADANTALALYRKRKRNNIADKS